MFERKWVYMGVARIFQREGHTVSNRGYSRFRNLNIVGCLRKKRLTKGGGGGSREPQDPPPLATPLVYKTYTLASGFQHLIMCRTQRRSQGIVAYEIRCQQTPSCTKLRISQFTSSSWSYIPRIMPPDPLKRILP